MLLLDLGDSSSFAWPLRTRDKQARAADRQDPLKVLRSTGKRDTEAALILFEPDLVEDTNALLASFKDLQAIHLILCLAVLWMTEM